MRLTYRELGDRLGISPVGARFLTRCRLWKVEKGNDGRSQVLGLPDPGAVRADPGRIDPKAELTS